MSPASKRGGWSPSVPGVVSGWFTKDHLPHLLEESEHMDPLKRWTSPETIDREFGYHPPSPVTGPVHDEVRTLLRNAAHRLNDLLPECPRKTDAINALRAAMWAANSAVACYGHDNPLWQEQVTQLLGSGPTADPAAPVFHLDPLPPDAPEAGAQEGHTETPL